MIDNLATFVAQTLGDVFVLEFVVVLSVVFVLELRRYIYLMTGVDQ